jgi:hypothetical protein
MPERATCEEAIRRTNLVQILAPFDPHIVGTPPLGIALPDSDIHIVCCAADQSIIAALLWDHFREADGFGIYQ